jgi:hypothetical protein
MAATVIDNYSTEMNQGFPGSPQTYSPLKANQFQGKLRVSTFTRVYTTEAAGDDTVLCIIPKGARILYGEAVVSATTGSATLAFGLMAKDASGFLDVAASVSDNTAVLKAAAAITTTAKVSLAATTALSYLYETEKDLYVTVTTAAAAMAAQTLSGHIVWALE